jgi:hypothetical protein
LTYISRASRPADAETALSDAPSAPPDAALPGSKGPNLGFLMYPQCENAGGRYDALDPDNFEFTISARELKKA